MKKEAIKYVVTVERKNGRPLKKRPNLSQYAAKKLRDTWRAIYDEATYTVEMSKQ